MMNDNEEINNIITQSYFLNFIAAGIYSLFLITDQIIFNITEFYVKKLRRFFFFYIRYNGT